MDQDASWIPETTFAQTPNSPHEKAAVAISESVQNDINNITVEHDEELQQKNFTTSYYKPAISRNNTRSVADEKNEAGGDPNLRHVPEHFLSGDATLDQDCKKKVKGISKPMDRRRIVRNLLLLAFGHFLVFTAFDSLSNLQSTMNSEQGIGMISQAVIYAFFTFSSFFLPTFIIRRFSCKTTLVLSVFSVCPYVAANIYPHWGTLIPSAVLCGLAFGPLWAARSTYVNEISFQYSGYVDVPLGVVNAWFFGIYSLFHENAEIWGNVISYLILKNPEDHSKIISNITLDSCGAEFCSEVSYDANPNLLPPSNEKRITLSLIYVAFILVAALVINYFLDPLDSGQNSNERETSLSCNLLVATMRHLRKTNQMLLVLLSFYCGVADGFYNSDYTKAYIGCAWGIPNVGFVTICYGVVSAVIDCLSGPLVKCLGRPLVFIFAAASHFIMLTTLLLWKPTPDASYVFFALSGVYGLGASVWWSQIAAFYGVLFKNDEEAAFSNFYFWSSLGFLVAYSYSDHLCVYVKIYLLLVILGLGIISYLIVELRTNSRLRDLVGSRNTD